MKKNNKTKIYKENSQLRDIPLYKKMYNNISHIPLTGSSKIYKEFSNLNP